MGACSAGVCRQPLLKSSDRLGGTICIWAGYPADRSIAALRDGEE